MGTRNSYKYGQQDIEKQIDERLVEPAQTGNVNDVLQLGEDGKPVWAVITPSGAPADAEMSDESSNAVQNRVIKAYVDAADAEIDAKKANTDGYYQTLTAGAAENLVGRGTTPAVISFRPAGGTQDIGTGAASIAKIKGSTDVWNMLARFSVSVALSSTIAGVDITHAVGSYVIRFNGQVSGVNSFNFAIGDVAPAIVSGHKYYISGTGVNGFRVRTSQSTGVQSAADGSGAICTASANSTAGQMAGDFTAAAVGHSFANYDINIKIVDLTLQYGAGREPATAAAFLAEYPEALTAPYNAGKLISNKVTALVTTGYNLYNPANGEAHLVANQKIQICGTYTGATIDGEAVVFDANGYFTPTRDCVMVVEGGNATDTDVHFSHSGIRDYGTANYQYEPYWTSTLNLDHSKIYGRLNGAGEMVQIAPNGFRGVGANYDEVDVVRKEAYIRRAWVDMGTLNYTRYQEGSFYLFEANNLTPTATGGVEIKAEGGYSSYVGYYIYMSDKQIRMGNTFFRVRNDAYSDAATFKTAMSGVMLDFQLATPLHYTDLMYSEDGGQTFTEIPSNYRVDDFGTERRLPEGIVDGAPASTPLVADIRYSMNAVDTLRRLPTNYLSKESTENLLAALQTAGVIAGYTMTYDDTNAQYDFTITPNA